MKNIDFEIGEYGIFPEEDSHNSYEVVGLDLPLGVLIDDLTINDEPLWVKLDGAKYPEEKELWSDRQKEIIEAKTSEIKLEDWQQEIAEVTTNRLKLQNDYLDKTLYFQGSSERLAMDRNLFANPDDLIGYKGFWIECEYPNGGLLAISIMDIFTKAWWSFPCDTESVEPFFGSTDSDNAIAWIKTIIDNIPTDLEAIAT